MTDDEKNIRMEQLRASLLKDIQLQEQVRETYRKILRRSTLILVTVGLVLISMVGFVIYTLTRPTPASEITLRHIETLEKNIVLERKINQNEREDVKIARTQILEMQAQLLKMQQDILKEDSIHHKK